LLDRFKGQAAAGEYFAGGRVQYLKYQNVAWVLLLSGGLFATIACFTNSFYFSLLGGLLAAKPFLSSTEAAGVNNLYTELPATALLAVACLALVIAVRRRKASLSVAAGLLFGLSALTKGTMLYVFACLIPVLLVMRGSEGASRPGRFGHTAVIVAAFAVAVLPWIGRNAYIFGQAQLSERGGLALYTRALMNQMSSVEYRGTFYVWARPSLQPIIGSWLGFTPEDLQLGGKLQRVSYGSESNVNERDAVAERDAKPGDAITDFRRGRAERKRLTRRYESEGVPYPDVAADKTLAEEGLRMLREDPVDDVKMAVPLLWRSAPLLFPVLAVGIGYCLRARRSELALYLLPGFTYLAFYALATPFEPRPALLAYPAGIVALLAMIRALWCHVSLGRHSHATVPAAG
jgi:4-amino-4-deoxy-L-arabinose transferase-like glycosyltransferase